MLEGLMDKSHQYKCLEAYDYLLETILDDGIKTLIRRVGIVNVAEWIQQGRYTCVQGRVELNE